MTPAAAKEKAALAAIVSIATYLVLDRGWDGEWPARMVQELEMALAAAPVIPQTGVQNVELRKIIARCKVVVADYRSAPSPDWRPVESRDLRQALATLHKYRAGLALNALQGEGDDRAHANA